MTAVLAAHTGGLLVLLGWLLVFACLIAAGVAAFRGFWVPALVLLVVAIVAAYLLL
jgi:hypothetical protein